MRIPYPTLDMGNEGLCGFQEVCFYISNTTIYTVDGQLENCCATVCKNHGKQEDVSHSFHPLFQPAHNAHLHRLR